MNCRELESRLEALLDGRLDEPERERCARHLAECPTCGELAEPLGAAAAPPDDLLEAVLASTSGPVCRRAEGLLGAWQEGELETTERQLVAAHLGSCPSCRGLAAAMTRLTAELPGLSELRPDAGFVEAVLAATLPVRVRLRRWWAAAWPRWVRRPRFASETAFVATLALVLVVAMPGSPLAALPTRALDLARTDPAAEIETRLEKPVSALERQFAARVAEPLGARYDRGVVELRASAGALAERARLLAATTSGWLGTQRDRLASFLGSADETASEDDDASKPSQETP